MMSLTSSTLVTESEKRPAILVLVSAIGFSVKVLNFSCVKSMTKMLSLQTMHLPVSSENCGLLVKPKAA